MASQPSSSPRSPLDHAVAAEQIQVVGKDPNNPEFLCSCGFSEKDWNEAYGAWVDLTNYDSSDDSEFDPDECYVWLRC